MTQSPIAAQIHQALDVHRDLTPEVTLDHVDRGRSFRGSEALPASVSWDTRRSLGKSDFLHDLASLSAGPMPWMYCNAITTRLLVGILTPAMRATVLTPAAGRQRWRARSLNSSVRAQPANGNATPSPFPGARVWCDPLRLDARFIREFNGLWSTSSRVSTCAEQLCRGRGVRTLVRPLAALAATLRAGALALAFFYPALDLAALAGFFAGRPCRTLTVFPGFLPGGL